MDRIAMSETQEDKHLVPVPEDELLATEKVFMGLTVKELKTVKDAVLQLKQGEALERGSWPRTELEGIGLGYFGPETLYALSLIISLEEALNYLAETPNDLTMLRFAMDVAVGSGSRGAKRLELTMDTIGRLGGSMVNASKDMPTPQHLGAKTPDK